MTQIVLHHGMEGGPKGVLALSGIRFDELEKVCEACADSGEGRRVVVDRAIESAPWWEGLAALGIEPCLVMDANKRILSVGKEVEQAVKNSFTKGLHLLDHALQGEAMTALLQLVVEMDQHRNAVADVRLDASRVLKGIFLGQESNGTYIVSVEKKRGRKAPVEESLI
jgi:hypothetical protein